VNGVEEFRDRECYGLIPKKKCDPNLTFGRPTVPEARCLACVNSRRSLKRKQQKFEEWEAMDVKDVPSSTAVSILPSSTRKKVQESKVLKMKDKKVVKRDKSNGIVMWWLCCVSTCQFSMNCITL